MLKTDQKAENNAEYKLKGCNKKEIALQAKRKKTIEKLNMDRIEDDVTSRLIAEDSHTTVTIQSNLIISKQSGLRDCQSTEAQISFNDTDLRKKIN